MHILHYDPVFVSLDSDYLTDSEVDAAIDKMFAHAYGDKENWRAGRPGPWEVMLRTELRNRFGFGVSPYPQEGFPLAVMCRGRCYIFAFCTTGDSLSANWNSETMLTP